MKLNGKINTDSVELITHNSAYKLHIKTPENFSSNIPEKIKSLTFKINPTFQNEIELTQTITNEMRALGYSEFKIIFKNGQPLIEDLAEEYFKEGLLKWLEVEESSQDAQTATNRLQQAFNGSYASLNLSGLNIKTIPADLIERLTFLEELICENCPLITSIDLNNHSKLQSLSFEDCPNLATIRLKNCPNLSRISCRNSSKLTDLYLENPHNLTDLNCSECRNLKPINLEKMPKLEFLDCSNCPLFTTLHLEKSLNLKHLDCSNCPLITTLNTRNMTSLTELFCSKCPITSLNFGNNLNLTEIDCTNCHLLTSLTLQNSPNLQFLTCYGCPLLSLIPEVPLGCTVRADTRFNNTTYKVPIEDLNHNPLDVLQKLNTYFKNGIYPSIQFVEENGALSHGIDVGGLRRHLQSTLFSRLFANNLPDLPFYLDTDGKIFPLVDPLNDSQIENYQGIGALCSFAYQNSLPIGTLFKRELFQAMLVFPKEKLHDLDFKALTDETKQQIFLALYKDTYQFISNYLEGRASKEDLEKIKLFVGSDSVPSESHVINHLNEVMNEPQMNQILVGALVLAKTVYTWLKKFRQPWETIQEKGWETLQEKIEGKLSQEVVLDRLKYSGRTNEKTKGYLATWIKSSDLNALKLFVKAVTGSTALAPNIKITIRLFSPDNPNTLPSSHTCSYELELPTTYDSQAIFNEKLQMFINESLAGSGFQFE